MQEAHGGRSGTSVVCSGFAAGISVLALILAACAPSSSEVEPTESPWKAYIDDLRPQVTDFAWQVLQDYEVTDAELQEARDRAKPCLTDVGIEAHYDYAYGGRYSQPLEMEDAQFDRLLDDCTFSELIRIESVHLQMRKNPNNVDIHDLYARCLIKAGLVDPGVQGNDLRGLSQFPQDIQESAEWRQCLANPLDVPELRDWVAETSGSG